MRKSSLTLLLFFVPMIVLIGQTITVSQFNTMILSNHNFGLTNPLFDASSPMTYDASQVNQKGAALSIHYTNEGGSSFDGYPSGTVGGFKTNGVDYPGNPNMSGLPIQIKDLTHNLRVCWKTEQLNANDSDDKWWATINVIFDSEPNVADRDFDLVIQNVSYVQDDFSDFINPGGRYWYFARETEGGAIKPFTLYINSKPYHWAVRYKFFDYPQGHQDVEKNDKVHVKFIPMDNSNPIPRLEHSLKQFIDCSLAYLNFVPLNPEERSLAEQKVADENLWIKSISAGYEVYEGSSILKNIHFYTVLDYDKPDLLTNLSATVHPTNKIRLDWDNSTNSDFDSYTIYRATNNGDYSPIAIKIRENTYLDETVDSNVYKYYVTAVDRSFNESDPSNFVTVDNVLSIEEFFTDEEVVVYPNPFSNHFFVKVDPNDFNGIIELFDRLGRKVFQQKISSGLNNFDFEGKLGLYFLKIIGQSKQKTISLVKM